MDWMGWILAALGMALLLLRLRRISRERAALVDEREVVLHFVRDVSEAFAEAGAGAPGSEFLLQRVLFHAQQTAKARAGAIYCTDPDGRALRARAMTGLFPPLAAPDTEPAGGAGFFERVERAVRDQAVRVGEGLVGAVAASGRPLLIADAERDARVPRFRSAFLAVETLLLVPMRFQNTVLGVLVLVNRIDDAPFLPSDLNLLQALADQASVTVYFAKFNEELDQKRSLDRDLLAARRIQQALLPERLPDLPGLELAAFSLPAREIGGDYYDVISLDDDRLGLVVADVSGKGVSGALLMSVCRSVVRAHAADDPSPARVLRTIQRILARDMQEDMFITMVYGILDRRSYALTFARAGHPHPLRVTAGGRVEALASGGSAIGLVPPECFDRQLSDACVRLEPGDLWVLYTDGVTEASRPGQPEWGLDNLRQTVLAEAARGAPAVVDRVRRELLSFSGGAVPYDDMTLLVARRCPATSGTA